jgi:hypothetical protein
VGIDRSIVFVIETAIFDGLMVVAIFEMGMDTTGILGFAAIEKNKKEMIGVRQKTSDDGDC